MCIYTKFYKYKTVYIIYVCLDFVLHLNKCDLTVLTKVNFICIFMLYLWIFIGYKEEN